jgi:hypothetical protein
MMKRKRVNLQKKKFNLPFHIQEQHIILGRSYKISLPYIIIRGERRRQIWIMLKYVDKPLFCSVYWLMIGSQILD